jgi:hypothetical protein
MSNGEIKTPIRLVDWQLAGGENTTGTKFVDAQLVLRDEAIRLELEDGREIWIELQDDAIKIHAYNATSDGPANMELRTSVAITADLTPHLEEAHDIDEPGEQASPVLTTRYHCTPLENLSGVLANGLVPAIGPRSVRIGEETAAVYLFESLEMAEDAIGGWLGDALEDDSIAKLAILEVDLDEAALGADLIHDGFSMSCTKPIPASAIRHLRTEPLDV